MVVNSAELEAADRVDARIPERVNDLLVVVTDDLCLEDEDVLRVVHTEAVGDIARTGDERDRCARLDRLWCVDRPRELNAGDPDDLVARAGGVTVGNVEDRPHQKGEEDGDHHHEPRSLAARPGGRTVFLERPSGRGEDGERDRRPDDDGDRICHGDDERRVTHRRNGRRCSGGIHGAFHEIRCGVTAADSGGARMTRMPSGAHDRGMRYLLVATDGSPAASAALDEAISLAGETGDGVAVITVWRALQGDYGLTYPSMALLDDLLDAERSHAEAALEDATARARAADVPVSTKLATGDPAERIVAYADEVDARLIAMGTRGYGAVASLLLGSTSNAVIRHASCPVLVVRESEQAVDRPGEVHVAVGG